MNKRNVISTVLLLALVVGAILSASRTGVSEAALGPVATEAVVVAPDSVAPLDQWISTYTAPDDVDQIYYWYTVGIANCVGMVKQTSCTRDPGNYSADYRVYRGTTCRSYVLPGMPNAWSLYGFVWLTSAHNYYAGDDTSPAINLVLPCLTNVTKSDVGLMYNLYPNFQPIVGNQYP